jgi:indole-3-acetate monooxygenase
MPTATLERVRELAPTIRRRADEIEAARRIPLDLVEDLKSIGCFRMVVPREAGGDELALDQQLDIIEELACADGSTGWTVMIGASSPVLFGLLPRRGFDEIYADGPDVIGAGALAPKGQARRVGDGYCVSGQWPFGSGCQHASWLLAQSIVVADGKPKMAANGVPEMRIMVVPAEQAAILDTWKVSGLRGTGSHDFRIDDVFCPDHRTTSLLGGGACIDAVAMRIPTLSTFSMLMAAVALGIGRAAIEDLTALAMDGKRRAFAAQRVAASPVFQDRLGEAEATWRAARALVHSEAARAWHMASAAQAFEPIDRARIRSAGALVVGMMARVADTAYTAGGGTSVYEASPLQRHLRDIHALTQHINVSRDLFAISGALLVGEEIDPGRPL